VLATDRHILSILVLGCEQVKENQLKRQRESLADQGKTHHHQQQLQIVERWFCCHGEGEGERELTSKLAMEEKVPQ
jgi:hypothetical protein